MTVGGRSIVNCCLGFGGGVGVVVVGKEGSWEGVLG